MEAQLGDYVRRGYIREVGIGERLYMSPLLPIQRQDGSYRFVNDYRRLNA